MLSQVFATFDFIIAYRPGTATPGFCGLLISFARRSQDYVNPFLDPYEGKSIPIAKSVTIEASCCPYLTLIIVQHGARIQCDTTNSQTTIIKDITILIPSPLKLCINLLQAIHCKEAKSLGKKPQRNMNTVKPTMFLAPPVKRQDTSDHHTDWCHRPGVMSHRTDEVEH